MNTFKHIALAAALCVTALGAEAADNYNSFFLSNDWASTPGELNGKFDISDVGIDAFSGVEVTHVAGDNFVDDYYFNIPDPQKVGFLVQAGFSSLETGFNPTVSFTSAVLYSATGLDTYTFGHSITTPYTLQGNTLTLTNGSYALEIVGTTLVDGGTYSGTLGTVALPVPEPASGGLMLAGLAAMGALLRRRARKA